MGMFGVTDEEYTAWLLKDGLRVVLADCIAYVGAAPVSRYLSNFSFITRPIDTPANTPYADAILEIPGFEAKLSEAFTGRSMPSWGDLIFYNPNGMFDSWLDDGWDGRAITLSLGAPTWNRPDFRPLLTGVVADIDAPARDMLALKLRDKTHLFDIPVQTNLIGGTTASKDNPIPLCFGQCFNVEPVLTIAASHTYQVHDGAIEAITAVRDNGDAVAYTADIATGTFTLNAAPVGRITADVKGAKPSGSYLVKCADIVQHLALNRAGLAAADIDSAAITALNASCAQTLGLYIKDRRNLIDVIDDLITSVGAFWTFTRPGLLYLGRLDAPAGTPVLTLIADDIEADTISMSARDLPVASVRLGYQKNWTPQDADALAGIVTEANRALYAAPYSVAKATNSVSTKHLMAPNPDVVETLIVSAADAVAEATRRAVLRSVVRSRVRETTFSKAMAMHLGDVVHQTHPRFGYSAGKLAVVVGLRERALDGRVEVELWK
jgi:hypothetical protein